MTRPAAVTVGKIVRCRIQRALPAGGTLRILEPEEEWRLLAGVVGDEIAAEILAAQESGNTDEECGTGLNVDEAAVVEETAVAEEDYKDFPTKWEI